MPGRGQQARKNIEIKLPVASTISIFSFFFDYETEQNGQLGKLEAVTLLEEMSYMHSLLNMKKSGNSSYKTYRH
jgi:hypothetical protein